MAGFHPVASPTKKKLPWVTLIRQPNASLWLPLQKKISECSFPPNKIFLDETLDGWILNMGIQVAQVGIICRNVSYKHMTLRTKIYSHSPDEIIIMYIIIERQNSNVWLTVSVESGSTLLHMYTLSICYVL